MLYRLDVSDLSRDITGKAGILSHCALKEVISVLADS